VLPVPQGTGPDAPESRRRRLRTSPGIAGSVVDFLGHTRTRLTLAYVGVISIVGLVASVVCWVAFTGSELASIDTILRSQDRVISAGLHETGGQVGYARGAALPADDAQGDDIDAVVLSPANRVLLQSGSPSIQLAQRLGPTATATPVITSIVVAGQDTRVLVARIPLSGGRDESANVVLAFALAEFDGTEVRIAAFLGMTVAALITLASLSGYWLAGRVLSPVRAITAMARDLSEHDLNRRITLDLPRDELGELASTFNTMLARLEASFTSLQQFTADAAHELRTPLALMRTELEVATRDEMWLPYQRPTVDTLLAEVERLSRTADQLLVLARADAGVLVAVLEPVDVVEFLEETAARWRLALTERDLRLRITFPPEGMVTADVSLLRRLVDNLVQNAVRHTPSGGTISLVARVEGDTWELVVSDTGPGVDPIIRGTLFERFTRSDHARSRETGGAGLGLSLCAAMAQLHGGDIRLDPTAPEGARFVARLPRSGIAA
jgi:signal transduction histidine kinase